MENNEGIDDILKESFEEHPIWKLDDEDDCYYRVYGESDFPDLPIRLFIRAEFVTKNNYKFSGYIVGVENIFSICIFWGKDSFLFNKNMIDFSRDYLTDLLKKIPQNIKPEDFFPVTYTTCINMEGYKELSGTFDAFEKENELKAKKWNDDLLK